MHVQRGSTDEITAQQVGRMPPACREIVASNRHKEIERLGEVTRESCLDSIKVSQAIGKSSTNVLVEGTGTTSGSHCVIITAPVDMQGSGTWRLLSTGI